MANFRSVAPLTGASLETIRALSGGVELGEGITLGSCAGLGLAKKVSESFGYDGQVKVGSSHLTLTADDDVEPGRAGEVWAEQKERLYLANLALWIAHPTDLGYEFLVQGDVDNGRFNQVGVEGRFWPIHALASYKTESLSLDDCERARLILGALVGVPRKTPLRSALLMLCDGLADGKHAIRFMLVWVAIEALFGPVDGWKVRSRIAQRASAFLASPQMGAAKVFTTVSRSWKARCAVVHGLRVEGLPADTDGIVREAEELVRSALLAIAASPEHVATFSSGPDRERYLASITAPKKATGPPAMRPADIEA